MSHVRGAMDPPFVLPRRIRPVQEPFEGEDGLEPWVLNWGIFHCALGYGGGDVRGSTDLDGGIINQVLGATSSCVFFEPS